MSDMKQKLLIGGAAVGAIVGGALLYHWLTAEGGAEEEANSELKKELSDMKSLEKDANGAIKLPDFINLFKVITKHSKMKISEVKANNASERRQFLKDKEEEKYRDTVKNQMHQEEEIYQEVANEAMDHFGIEEQEFMMAQQVHMMNPMFQKTMMEV